MVVWKGLLTEVVVWKGPYPLVLNYNRSYNRSRSGEYLVQRKEASPSGEWKKKRIKSRFGSRTRRVFKPTGPRVFGSVFGGVHFQRRGDFLFLSYREPLAGVFAACNGVGFHFSRLTALSADDARTYVRVSFQNVLASTQSFSQCGCATNPKWSHPWWGFTTTGCWHRVANRSVAPIEVKSSIVPIRKSFGFVESFKVGVCACIRSLAPF